MRPVDPITAAADAAPAEPALADPHGAAHALVERQLAMLTRLAEMGMAIAEATERWALAALDAAAASPVLTEDGPPALPAGFRGDPGLVYSRVARAVRLTLMLQTRLLQELPALGRARTLADLEREEARRDRARRLVERAIKAEHTDPDAIEQLSGDAWERLRDEDLGDEFGAAPLGEVVARICRDLGLSPDWGERAMAAAGAAAGAAGADPLGHPEDEGAPANGEAETWSRLAPSRGGGGRRRRMEEAWGAPIGHDLAAGFSGHPRE